MNKDNNYLEKKIDLLEDKREISKMVKGTSVHIGIYSSVFVFGLIFLYIFFESNRFLTIMIAIFFSICYSNWMYCMDHFFSLKDHKQNIDEELQKLEGKNE